MNLPQSEQLNIGYFSRLFHNTTNCYKFFWFNGILKKLEEGKRYISFDEILNEMIADAWYMVTAYHLKLGPNGITDNLEEVVKYIFDKENFKPAEDRATILSYLENSDDRNILRYKKTLIVNVPYRLQAPFYDVKIQWHSGARALADAINANERLIYYFTSIDGINSSLEVTPYWEEYLLKNIEIIKGWLELNLIHYLQRRNPSVPGIADKLSCPKERNLEKVKKYWKAIIEVSPVKNIYTGDTLNISDISIDHFVPWSYVAHDELWNLVPTTKAVNSSKNNNLPVWDIYFPKLAAVEYSGYMAVARYEGIRCLQKDCLKEHVNNDEIRGRLYGDKLDERSFTMQLEKILKPAYDSAMNMGFRIWSHE